MYSQNTNYSTKLCDNIGPNFVYNVLATYKAVSGRGCGRYC